MLAVHNDAVPAPTSAPPTFDVVVPSYKRPDCLVKCLDALARQTLRPHGVYVVLRRDDAESHKAVEASEGRDLATVVHVPEPGFLQALNAGIDATTGEFVALTDDDAVADPEWLSKLHAYYSDPNVVGVGGRDILPWYSKPQKNVGRINWYGKSVGYHHCGVGGPRKVEVIKGVNCSYRGEWLRRVRIDTALRGKGTQDGTETALGSRARIEGLSIIYDPNITVGHFPAPRVGEVQRTTFDVESAAALMYNKLHSVGPMLTEFGRMVMFAHVRWIGSPRHPGVLMVPVCRLKFGANESKMRREAVLLAFTWLSADR